jgi:3-keto-disaccharide hydrolase
VKGTRTNRRWSLLLAVATSALVMMGCQPDAAPPPSSTPLLSLPREGATTVGPDLADAGRWETVAGKWEVRRSGQETLLLQTATDAEFPLLLLPKPSLRDVDISVRFRPVSGKEDASGGIVFRARDGKNYYVVRANSLEDNFRLYMVASGSRKQIAGTAVQPPALGAWHTLRVVAVDDHIQACLNGRLLIDHHDDTFRQGRIGLWTKADAVTEFTDLKISENSAAGGS